MAAAARYAVPANPYWMQFGMFGYHVYFGANWDISSMQDAGRSWWLVKKLTMSGSVDNGKLCKTNNTCAGHWLLKKAEFLNAANQVVYTANPSSTSCGPQYLDPADVTLVYCSGDLQLSKTITKIRFSWKMNVQQIFPGWWWSTQLVTKTVPIS